MATRQFDYAAIQEIYSNMNKTIGTSADADSIAGVLHALDQNVQEYIGVCDEAIYGPLGKQLLLDWLNTSSNFPNFVENFNSWSQLVAASGGDYSDFEKDVAGFRELNPLGTYSGEATTNFVDNEKYSAYTQEDIDTMSASVLGMYAEVGDAYFVDTNMVEYEKQRKTMDIVMFGVQGITTILSVIPAGKILGTIGKAGTSIAKTGAATGAKALTSTGAKALTTSATKTGTSVMAKLGAKIAPKVTAAGAKIASVARAAATGIGKFAKSMATKTGRAAIVKSAKSLIKNIPSALKTGLKTAGGKIVEGAKSAGKTIATSAKNTAGKASGAFKSIFNKSLNQTDDYMKYMKQVTKDLNKSASKVVVNGTSYTKPVNLVDDFAKGKIGYDDFKDGFIKMFEHSKDPNTKYNILDFFTDQCSKNEAFNVAFANGRNAANNVLSLTTSEAPTKVIETVLDVVPNKTKISNLRSIMLEFGLRGVQKTSYNTFDEPPVIINTGAVA